MISVERTEDMGTGTLKLLLEEDGDICVIVTSEVHGIPMSLEVQFCNSGGNSPRTLKVLQKLLSAMQEDQNSE